MASPDSKTDICNLALSRIGAKAVTETQIDEDKDPRAQHCNRHYEQTRDALIRSHWWRFASARVDLAVVANGKFAKWTADNPDDWTATEAGTDDVSQVGAGEGYGGSGTKKCNIYSAALGTGVQVAQTITTVVGLEYRFSIHIDTITAGELAVENLPAPTDGDTDWDSTGIKTVIFTADDTSFSLVIKGYTAAATDITFDNISVVVVPDFEWSYGYILPSDFLRMKSIFADNNTTNKTSILPYALEDKILLYSESTCEIRYIKQVTTVADFDPLFIETFILQLGLKLIPPLAGVGSAGQGLMKVIRDELYGRDGVMARVRTMDRQETNTIPPNYLLSWAGSRLTNAGRIDSKLGSL